jgi:hypothetical protein
VNSDSFVASVVVHDMGRTDLASYGFRSWMLQDIGQPYEVVACLFNDQAPHFSSLVFQKNDRCSVKVRSFPQPAFFNISAANNLGLHEATGDYILFANADIIYPSHFLRTFIGELRRREIMYAKVARVQLTSGQTAALANPETYVPSSNFDFLVGLEHRPENTVFHAISPWTVKRDVALTIGGFDAQILCHEDGDFDNRVVHYLRRQGLQEFIYSAADLFGYHLAHARSELFDASVQSLSILERRRSKMAESPDAQDDCLPTLLSSRDALLKDLLSTVCPPPRSIIRGGLRRVRRAWNFLVQGW